MGRTNWPARPAQQVWSDRDYDPTPLSHSFLSLAVALLPSLTHTRTRPLAMLSSPAESAAAGKIRRRHSPAWLRLAVLRRLPYTAAPLCVCATPSG
jgi:hypothetical protein